MRSSNTITRMERTELRQRFAQQPPLLADLVANGERSAERHVKRVRLASQAVSHHREVLADSEDAARIRLRVVLADIPALAARHPEFIPSNSNDAWFFDDQVLRVCWRGDRARLRREEALLEALPPEIPHPAVRACGSTGELTWLLTSRVNAVPLTAHWTRGDSGIAAVIEELASHLRRLHQWAPPPDIEAAIDDISPPVPVDGMLIAGRSMIPLPWARMQPIVDLVARAPWVDPGVVCAAAERAQQLASDLPEEPHRVVHGDASPSNVLVTSDGKLASIIDWEWTRWGPAALELLPMLLVWASRAGLDPSEVTGPMQRGYPELFAQPSLEQRLWFYEIVYNMRGLAVWPATTEESKLSESHPLRQLRRLADGPTLRFD